MEKNYYKILEIDIDASAEIVDKAYKTLAKKYHPDLQADADKSKAEEKMKELNEAFEVLSDPDKRKKYDELIKIQNAKSTNSANTASTANAANTTNKTSTSDSSQSQQSKNVETTIEKVENETNDYDEELQILEKKRRELEKQQRQIEFEQQVQSAVNKAYHDAYIQDLKNRGYKIKYKKSFKDYLRIIVSVLIVILIIFLICQIPPIKEYFKSLYNENEIIHWFVDFITNSFNNITNKK